MRIDFTNLGLEKAENTKAHGTGRPATTEGQASTGATSSADRAQFSFDSARVQSMVGRVLAAPEVRSERVASLKEALGHGKYTADARKVADAMAAEVGRVQNR